MTIEREKQAMNWKEMRKAINILLFSSKSSGQLDYLATSYLKWTEILQSSNTERMIQYLIEFFPSLSLFLFFSKVREISRSDLNPY